MQVSNELADPSGKGLSRSRADLQPKGLESATQLVLRILQTVKCGFACCQEETKFLGRRDFTCTALNQPVRIT
jgi:hypothetical protein